MREIKKQMISRFSVIVAVVLFNATLLFVWGFRRRTGFLVRYRSNALLSVALFSILRIVLPLDFKLSRVINSYSFLPTVSRWLNTPLFHRVSFLTPANLIVAIWIGGALVVAVGTVLNIQRSRLRSNKWLHFSCPQAEKILTDLRAKRATVVLSPNVHVPMVTGIFKTHIFFPMNQYTDAEMSLALRHELQHFKLRDIWIKLFYLLLAAVFWWNPIVHMLRQELDYLLELRCDMALTDKMDERQRAEYMSLILKVAGQTSHDGFGKSDLLATALVKERDQKFLRQRMDMIAHPLRRLSKFKSIGNQVLAICVAATIFIASYFIIIQPAYMAPDIVDSVPVYDAPADTSYILVENGVHKVYLDGEYFMDATPEQIENSFPDFKIIEEVRR